MIVVILWHETRVQRGSLSWTLELSLLWLTANCFGWMPPCLHPMIVIETRPDTMWRPWGDVSDGAQIHSVSPRCISRVHSLLTSVGLRRESRQSVVSWRSDSEDVTYSRSKPAKCNCAIMPWWQSMCVRLCQQFATKIASHKKWTISYKEAQLAWLWSLLWSKRRKGDDLNSFVNINQHLAVSTAYLKRWGYIKG